MIDPSKFIDFFSTKKIQFFTGVPDSLLKNLLKKLENLKDNKHLPATSEGSAISIAAGYYLSTKKLACVYLQNSGLGNAINPLASITHSKVYSIPMVLIIGWRGEPGVKDEPQHMVKGLITRNLLKLLKIKYKVLSSNTKLSNLSKLIEHSKKKLEPVALLVKKDCFEKPLIKVKIKRQKNLSLRKDFISSILNIIPKNTKIISTTGYTSRELNQIRRIKNVKNGKDFYMVGGMGHTASLSLGVALGSKNKVICLDGDGSLLMHMGSMTTIGHNENKNFYHFLFDNKAHESVGGQKILSKNIRFDNLALSIGYKKVYNFISLKKFERKIKAILKHKGPVFINIKIKSGILDNLKRPKDFLKIKNLFISK